MPDALSDPSATTATTPSPPLLGAIRAATFAVSDLDAVEAAWTQSMGYRVVERGAVSSAIAAAWGTPALAGRAFLILGPASGASTVLRFVDQPTTGEAPDRHAVRWSVAELTVQNADELHARLQNSAFEIRSASKTVPTYEYLRAMTACGPSGEHLNLTWITEKRSDLAVADAFVGRCFIAVMGAPSLQGALDFYQETFGNLASPIRQLPSVKLAVVGLDDGSKIEIDEFADLAPRQALPGFLPPGLAMVSFECRAFDRFAERLIAPAAVSAFAPFTGKRIGVMPGAAGELLELIDIPSSASST